ncbi:Acetylornithine deacetylase [Serinicoccus hydrothermalis]|uniref:Probable succinyl-diaminopimelate desuccinylase n=1 Tax=Serinicoccus hydrothermalis TaxID=1758689 RepID=A0A1B1N8P1_9MICO|nr:M20 family metallopeptidase [Serinicoccus hydrothermalis]ANS77800.1 Acetylornithine deacetylase [Serinicoccus hydrothermalis]
MTPGGTAALDTITAERLVPLAQALVRAPGANPPGQEAATAAVLADLAQQLHLEVEQHEVAPGRPNVRVTLPGQNGPGLLFLGHTDVVPPGELADWSDDPYAGGVVDGRLVGRGSADMKGGLAAVLLALAMVRESGIVPSGPVLLDALCDEEQNGLGIRDLVAGPRPDLLGCVVAEPTDLTTVVAARGASYLHVEVRGVAAHAGRPEDGRNAIGGAAQVVADLERWHEELRGDVHPLVGPATLNVGVIAGGTSGSAVPDLCRVEVDRRLLPGEPVEAVLETLRGRLERLDLGSRGLTWTLSSPMDMPGFETPPEHRFVTRVDGAMSAAGRGAAPLAGWTAACDGGFVADAWGIPVVVQGPGSVSDQAHRPDESVAVEELVVAARGYARTVLELMQPTGLV